MVCIALLIVSGLLVLPRLRDIGFFGAVRTQSPDIEISKKQGNLGVSINLPPSLTADIDSLYSGRAATNAPAGGPMPGQDLFSYFASAEKSLGEIIGRNLDSGQSISNTAQQTSPKTLKVGII